MLISRENQSTTVPLGVYPWFFSLLKFSHPGQWRHLGLVQALASVFIEPVWVMNSFFVHASWLCAILWLHLTHKDSASYSQMSVLGVRRICGWVWMVCLKYVPANSRTSPPGPKHLCSEGSSLPQQPWIRDHFFSQREDSQACSSYLSVLHDFMQCLWGRREVSSANWDWQW